MRSNHDWRIFTTGVSGMAGCSTLALLSLFGVDILTCLYWSALTAALFAFATMAYVARPVSHPTLVAAPVEQVASPNPAVPYSDEWRTHWHKFFTYSRDCGGIQFERVKAFFGEHTRRQEALIAWRELLTPFIRASIIAPITAGKPTDFVAGYSLEWVIGRLDSARLPVSFHKYIPAYPPPAPFVTPATGTITVAETVDNARETVIRDGNSGTVSYARDV